MANFLLIENFIKLRGRFGKFLQKPLKSFFVSFIEFMFVLGMANGNG